MNSPTISSGVCIAGAHRSGTSMLTRLLHACGLDLGAETDLMPARPDNPDGFWENLRFVSLNDELLGELGGAWDLPPRRTEDFADARLDSLRSKAKLLIGEFDPASTWGWKDPRNSLTLPFWKSILPGLKTIMIVRNPLEVAHSMGERNGTSYSFGLRLWEIYNRRIIETTTAEDRLLTHYDSFFENCESELRRIASFIGLSHSEVGRAAALVATGRRHTHFTLEQLVDARVSVEVIDFYGGLVDEAKRGVFGKSRKLLAPSPNSARAEGADLLPGSVSRINASISEREAKLADLTLHLAQQDGRIREMEATIGRAAAELENMRERFVQTNHLLHSKSIILTELEGYSTRLIEQLRKQLQATKKLLRLLDDAEDAAERLRHSRRWKMANPFAWLGSIFGRCSMPGFGHLGKVLETYHRWRSSHPEMEELDDAIQSLAPRGIPAGLSETASDGGQMRRCEPRAPSGPIEFPAYEQVEVSIIVPVFNQFHFTQACLVSVQENHDGMTFEVIVVDDCSTDATAEIIAKIPGVVYVRNEPNAGFIASCNRGARMARGSYLLFLNNDTIVMPGWLAALRETFDFEARVGLVGSKLIFPDGRLQEAGGIIWRDASGWNRGKFQDAEKPEYNFLREVDYCSAASLMIPKSLFESLGGFDSKYAPAYYEDTDLAFKVRNAGYKVLYQPLSKVIHYEGATGGTDLAAGAKKYQEINRSTFAARWAGVLAEKPPNGDIPAYDALKREQKRILVIDHHLPMPDRDSGSLRMFQILKILHGLGHRVTFLPDNLADIPPYADDLKKRGIEVVYYPHIKGAREYLETHGREFDVVILSRADFARKHIADVRQYAPQARLIFDTVDLHFLREEREAGLTQDPDLKQKATEKRQLEYELIDQADETWVVSPVEQELLHAEWPDKSIEVVSNIVDIPGSTTPFSLRSDLLFIGSFQHTPNIDAAFFFTQEIFPLVRQQLPAAKFYIIGDKAPPQVIALADEQVVVTGYQPDVSSYFDRIKLSVAPLRFGAGIKGKINQSMAFGVPVVATSLAVEGMALTQRDDILMADDRGAFAAAVIELYQSEELWQRLSRNSVRQMKELYSVDVARENLRHLLSSEQALPDGRRIAKAAAGSVGIQLNAVGAQS